MKKVIHKIIALTLSAILIGTFAISSSAEKSVLHDDKPYSVFEDDFSASNSVWGMRYFNDLKNTEGTTLIGPKPVNNQPVTLLTLANPGVNEGAYSYNLYRTKGSTAEVGQCAPYYHAGFMFPSGKTAKSFEFSAKISEQNNEIWVWLGEKYATAGILDSNDEDTDNDDLTLALVMKRDTSDRIVFSWRHLGVNASNVITTTPSYYTAGTYWLESGLNFADDLTFKITFEEFINSEKSYQKTTVSATDSNGETKKFVLPFSTTGQIGYLPSRVTGFALGYKGTSNTTNTSPSYDTTFSFDDVRIVFNDNPEMKGATILKTNDAMKQDMKFGASINFITDSSLSGYTSAGYGVLVARTAYLNGAQLEVGNTYEYNGSNVPVIDSFVETADTDSVDLTVTIGSSAIEGNTGKKYSARAYAKYVKEGAEPVYIYTDQIDRSVYGYAKSMASDVLAEESVNYTITLSDKTEVTLNAESVNSLINGKSTDKYDDTHTNADCLLAFIYANS